MDENLKKVLHNIATKSEQENAAPIEQQAPVVAQDSEVELPIGQKEIDEANKRYMKYKSDKSNIDTRIVRNEQWYKMRHWHEFGGESNGEKDIDDHSGANAASGWLLNVILNKHADMMDNYPMANFLPREQSDTDTAKMLSSIVPVILDHANMEQVYSDAAWYKLKNGTSCFCVSWDGAANNGLGEVAVSKVDLLQLFWETGVKDIQESRDVFYVSLQRNDDLIALYPQLQGKLTSATTKPVEYIHDTNIDTTNKSAVIDWYYKKNGKLQYARFCNTILLFSSENEAAKGIEQYANGFYAHGLYPFVFDTLFPLEDSLVGFGYIDIGKDAQEYIDRCNKAIIENTIVNATPRWLIAESSDIKADDLADITKAVISCQGNIDDMHFRKLESTALSSTTLNVVEQKINELKEVTGNRDVSTGGSTSGVTAASAIAAMQESGAKIPRDTNKATYRAYKHICKLIVELIRQFYDTPRWFRVTAPNGAAEFIAMDNAQLGETPIAYAGEELGSREPIFDIEITASKASPYSRMAQNEMALQFYNAGFFAPANADAALATLEMMDFDRKDKIMGMVQQNGTLFQQVQMLTQQVQQLLGIIGYADGKASAAQPQSAPQSQQGAEATVKGKEALGDTAPQETKAVTKTREMTADATAPR